MQQPMPVIAEKKWRSALGNEFPRKLIDSLDDAHHKELRRLRALPANGCCAECRIAGRCQWASVTLGAFVCERCADVHRALGVHISKVKGCGGTYLWGPDEIEQMQKMGNSHVEETYECKGPVLRPAAGACKEEWINFCMKKYHLKVWAAGSARQDPPTSAPGAPCGVPMDSAAPARRSTGAPLRAATAPAGPDFDDFFLDAFASCAEHAVAEAPAQRPVPPACEQSISTQGMQAGFSFDLDDSFFAAFDTLEGAATGCLASAGAAKQPPSASAVPAAPAHGARTAGMQPLELPAMAGLLGGEKQGDSITGMHRGAGAAGMDAPAAAQRCAGQQRTPGKHVSASPCAKFKQTVVDFWAEFGDW